MQKLILSIVILGFAVAVQAGESKTESKIANEKEKSACCSQKADQAKASNQATGSCCSMDKTACKQAPVRQVLMSPKAAAEYAKK
jgi:hypothetical protein